jgi:hypothetical protein
MSKRRRSALAVLAAAVAAVPVLLLPASPASAGSAAVSNACANSVTANFSQIEVTTSGDDGLTAVAPGGATTTTGLSQSGAVPGAIFVAGYNLGLLVVGENNIPATVNTKIEATNTTQGTQTSSNAATSVTTFITDPDGTPGTGDESGTDATFVANYADMNWTAGASGLIDYRQESIAAWPATDANNTLRIQAVVGGFLNVIFRCAPGTVTPPDPGTVALIDPAPSFDTTLIQPLSQISIDDQTVTEGGAANFTVSLDVPQAAPVTVDFMTADGTAVAPGDYTSATGTVTFVPGDTAETVTVQTIDDALKEGDETFNVNLSNETGNADIADAQGVGTIPANDDNPPTANAGADFQVNEGTMGVMLDGTASSDPDGEALTFAWTQLSGPTVTLTGANTATPSFTAPQVDPAGATLEFQLEVCDQADPTELCATDTVVVTVVDVPLPLDLAGEVIVNGPVKAGQTAKTYVFRVSNVGGQTATVDCATEIDAAVLVNGVANGSVTCLTASKTISPGARARFRLRWTGTAPLVAGDIVTFTADVNEPGDVDTANDADSATFGPLG